MQKLNTSKLLIWALLLTMFLGFDSCKKDDDNPTVATTTIEGSYKLNSLTIDPKALGLYSDLIAASKLLFNNTTCLTDITLTFKTGGDATTDSPATCEAIGVPVSTFTGVDASSKWTLVDKKLTVTKGDGTKTDYTVVSNTGGILKLQWQGTLNYPAPSTTVYTYTMELKKQ
ncbi:lipocalin family protein [Spirosoma litoris]